MSSRTRLEIERCDECGEIVHGTTCMKCGLVVSDPISNMIEISVDRCSGGEKILSHSYPRFKPRYVQKSRRKMIQNIASQLDIDTSYFKINNTGDQADLFLCIFKQALKNGKNIYLSLRLRFKEMGLRPKLSKHKDKIFNLIEENREFLRIEKEIHPCRRQTNDGSR